MRISISPTNYQFNHLKNQTSPLKKEDVAFKGDNFDFDNSDSFSEPSVFDILRDHILSKTLVGAEEKIKNLSNSEIARLNCVRKHQSFDKKLINNFRRTYNNSYRGESLAFKPEKFNEIKGYGVERVIDLIGYDEYKENCDKNNLDYICFDVASYFNDSSILGNKSVYIMTKKHEYEAITQNSKLAKTYAENLAENYPKAYKDAVDNFVNFMQTVEKGHFYISCDHGVNKTNKALMLIAYFSPICSEYEYQAYVPGRQQLRNMQAIYKALTPNDKKKLGYTEEFDSKLKKRLELS